MSGPAQSPGKRALLIALLAGFLLPGGCARGPSRTPWVGAPPELWFYEIVNIGEKDVVDRITPLWIRARKAGYRRVVLADVKFGRLGTLGYSYFDRAHRLAALADSIGLDIVPGVFQVGRSSTMLAENPDLAEGLPVVDARFEVRGGEAHLVPDPPVAFPKRPTGHDFEARPGPRTATTGRTWWRGRWWYDVPVSPHRCYHVSVWTRTRGFKGKPGVRVLGGGRVLHFMKNFGIERNQDWTEHHVVFNSLGHSSVRVYFGVWRRSRGKIEWRDWRIEEVGPVNLLRRPGAPFAARDEATGRRLVEGVDLVPVADTLMGQSPWAGQFDEWHAPPTIRTRLPDGTRLRLSWHHAAIVYDKQVTCCLSEPETFERLEDEARRLRELWGPGRYLMMFDEIRALGGDSACARTGWTPGRILAEATRRCAGFLPHDTLYAWNDMYDPLHNAVPDYFLVQGDLSGAWEGLDRSIGVANWNGDHARESLRYFAERGHHQVIAGYYDGSPEDVADWIRAAAGLPGIEAVMYTTWEDRYDDLEAFAEAARAALP